MLIHGYTLQYMDIHGDTGNAACRYMAIHVNTWFYMAIHDYTWKYMVKHGNTWPYMVKHGNIRPYMIILGKTWHN